MSDLISSGPRRRREKPVVWLHGEVRSPPFSAEARKQVGHLLGRLQRGDTIEMPHSRPMLAIGPRCHELRVRDAGHRWRIFHRVDRDAARYDRDAEGSNR